MTWGEAIQALTGLRQIASNDSLDATASANQRNTAIDMAIDALKLQKPRKLYGDGCGWAFCPNCERYIEDYHPAYGDQIDGRPMKHCPECGQTLIWEVTLDEQD